MVRSVAIDFGDGATLAVGTTTAAVSVPHEYTEAATYTIQATGFDVIGRALSATTQVFVN